MKRHRGQGLNAYSLLLAIVIIAIIGMNLYVKRGLQGRYADVVDFTTTTVRNQAGRTVYSQYEPNYASSDTTISTSTMFNEQIRPGSRPPYYLRRDFLAGKTKVNSISLEGEDAD